MAQLSAADEQEVKELISIHQSTLTDAENLLAKLNASEFIDDELLDMFPELKEELTKNEKLKYRKRILEGSITRQQAANKAGGKQAKVAEATKPEPKGARNPKLTDKFDYIKIEEYGSSILGRLTDIFTEALHEAYPDIQVPLTLNECQTAKFGDYQCNSAMAIANKLKTSGAKIRPSEVAENIKNKLKPSEFIDKVDVVPAGFINIFLNKAFVEAQVGAIASKGVQLPRIPRKRVVIDFSSPNIAKEMHVGHLRSTIIGDSIARLFELVGFDVVRINHVGDWGTQFGMLIAHLKDSFPNFLTETPPIADLQSFYKESKKRFDEDADFKARAYQCVVKLQSYDPDHVKGWQMICDVSRKYFQQIYDRLDIKITERGESFYQNLMPGVVEELKSRGVLKEEEGRMVMFPTGCDVPLTVVKSDGGFTYDTSDLAALKQRLNDEKADWIIYVIDAGQSLHIESIFAAARDLGWYNPQTTRVEHVGFGLVLGDDKKKFKTRSGDTVRLLDLLDEGIARAAQKTQEKGRDQVMSAEELANVQDAVAYGCIKYADLSHTRTMDYVFSFDRMLDDRGNTAVYLLYAYTRIKSIGRTCGVTEEELNKWLADHPAIPLTHPAEFKLAKAILKLSDVLLNVLDSLMMHPICDYLYQLSTVFADFYKECYVIDKKDGSSTIHFNRLALCNATATVMLTCFNVLGLRETTKM